MDYNKTSIKKPKKRQIKRGSVSRYDMTQQRIMTNIENYNVPSMEVQYNDSLFVINQPQKSVNYASKEGS
jgi:hypothetical protein